MNGDAPKKSKQQRMKLKVNGAGGSAGKMPVSKQVGVFVLLIWFLVPVFVFALAWIFGGILARVEGWPAMVRSALHRARTRTPASPCALRPTAGSVPRGLGAVGARPGRLACALRLSPRSLATLTLLRRVHAVPLRAVVVLLLHQQAVWPDQPPG
jgi:hypothetical protein